MACWPALAAMSHKDKDMQPSAQFERKDALAISQGAIGNQLDDVRLHQSHGSDVQLSD
ncbi:MAG: hypothetical protein HUJ31_01650, partial [Pseudomonadales bacterium]|nr:hypothetical protein [Pseudomonadales bacterium]